MQAHEIMINQVFKVKVDDTVRTVIEKFISHGISGLPVVNDRNEVVGYISDGDILRYIGKHDDFVIDTFLWAAVVKGDNEDFEARVEKLLGLNVRELAQRKVIKVAWDEDVEKVAAILGKKQIKKVPVERNGVLVGIVSRGDVIRNCFKSIL